MQIVHGVLFFKKAFSPIYVSTESYVQMPKDGGGERVIALKYE